MDLTTGIDCILYATGEIVGTDLVLTGNGLIAICDQVIRMSRYLQQGDDQ